MIGQLVNECNWKFLKPGKSGCFVHQHIQLPTRVTWLNAPVVALRSCISSGYSVVRHFGGHEVWNFDDFHFGNAEELYY